MNKWETPEIKNKYVARKNREATMQKKHFNINEHHAEQVNLLDHINQNSVKIIPVPQSIRPNDLRQKKQPKKHIIIEPLEVDFTQSVYNPPKESMTVMSKLIANESFILNARDESNTRLERAHQDCDNLKVWLLQNTLMRHKPQQQAPQNQRTQNNTNINFFPAIQKDGKNTTKTSFRSSAIASNQSTPKKTKVGFGIGNK